MSQSDIVYFRGRNRAGAFVQGYRRESPGDLAERLFRARYEDVEIRRFTGSKASGDAGRDGDLVGRIERGIDGKRVWWGER